MTDLATYDATIIVRCPTQAVYTQLLDHLARKGCSALTSWAAPVGYTSFEKDDVALTVTMTSHLDVDPDQWS